MFARSRPVSMVNGRVVVPNGVASSLRFTSRIVGIDDRPRAGDEIVDLDGAIVWPGLINAHEHLELNHYGQLKRRDRYDNAADWIDDLRPVIREDASIRRNSAFPLADRLFVGGLKNVLAGVTTVAHHNPIYRELNGRFPVRVIRTFGWAHSFQLEDRPVGANGEMGGRVVDRCRSTPSRFPFIVHAAEGIDRAAADEIDRLEQLGCLRANTVLVHGVGITDRVWPRILKTESSLIWCPASNRFLFEETVPVRKLLDASPDAWMHICLGTDSRLTGSRDLLDEMRVATDVGGVTAGEAVRMVTTAAAHVLRLPDAGKIAIGGAADLVVIPPARSDPAASLLETRRADIRCVTIAGRPLVATKAFGGLFSARGLDAGPLNIDGVERIADARLVRAIERCPIQEPGVAVAC